MNPMSTESFSWGLSLDGESVSSHGLDMRINYSESQVSKSRYPGSRSRQTLRYLGASEVHINHTVPAPQAPHLPPPAQGVCLLLAGFPGLPDLLSGLASKGCLLSAPLITLYARCFFCFAFESS